MASAKRVTLADLARKAGVSPATASKALNGHDRVSEATRRKVEQVAQELDYRPNSHAQALASGRSNSIGIVTSDLNGRWSIPILIGAEDELGATSSSVLLNDARGDALLEKNAVELLTSRGVDGIIIAGSETNLRQPLNPAPAVPVVYAYAPSVDPNDCSITADSVQAGRLAVDHLLSCGKHKIAIIGGDRTYKAATDELEGELDELHKHHLRVVGTIRFNSWSEDWGRAATLLLLREKADFDAVICQNDQIARGCLTVLRARNIKVPRDVAVIGHDDWQTLTLGSLPPLTSIANPIEEIGHRAVHAIMDAISGHPHHGVDYLPCTVVQRNSTLPLNTLDAA